MVFASSNPRREPIQNPNQEALAIFFQKNKPTKRLPDIQKREIISHNPEISKDCVQKIQHDIPILICFQYRSKLANNLTDIQKSNISKTNIKS